jgi:hypothetical protein
VNADETLTLRGSITGVTSGMNITKVGFVVSDVETVGISTAADYNIEGTLGTDGSFAGTLQADYADRYAADARVYMRAYAIINGHTYYTNAKSWLKTAQPTTIETITMKTSGTEEMDLSDYSEITINHLYDNGGVGQYSNNCDGYLRLIAAEGCTWKITGNVETESTSYDWLTVYDGQNANSSFVGGTEKIGGRPMFNINLQSTSNVILIRFRTDGSSVYSGIDLQLKAE